MKTGPALYVNSQIVRDMMADPGFFAAVPVFYFLKDVAAAVIAKLDECGNCQSGPMVRESLVRPFVSTAVQIHKENPDALKPLQEYLAKRLHHQPRVVSIPYETDGIRHTLELRP